jgi:hypothetical protein
VEAGDIDSQRMTSRIEQRRGRKDRYAMLSPVLLELESFGYRPCEEDLYYPRHLEITRMRLATKKRRVDRAIRFTSGRR